VVIDDERVHDTIKQIAGMKLTEYFLKLCESCLPESEGKLKTH
jgi:hypothetical protein